MEGGTLVKVEGIVRHFKLDEVCEALARLGVSGITLTEVHGFGRQMGRLGHYRGAEYLVDFVPKLRFEVVVPDRDVAKVVETIIVAAKTGQVGDGKVFVSKVADAIRIRTGETGDNVI